MDGGGVDGKAVGRVERVVAEHERFVVEGCFVAQDTEDDGIGFGVTERGEQFDDRLELVARSVVHSQTDDRAPGGVEQQEHDAPAHGAKHRHDLVGGVVGALDRCRFARR